MNESRSLDAGSVQASVEIDQAISSIKANLSQPKDLVITEIVNYCTGLQSSRGFTKLEEIFLMYLEKQSELPKLDNNVIDNLIELLLFIIGRNSPSKTPRAFVLFARFLTNPEKLSGNDSIRDRFKYSPEKIQRLSLPIYLGNPIYKQWALALCVGLLENYSQASINHFSNDPGHIEAIRQAEKNAMRFQLKTLLDQQAEDKEFITKAFAEMNEKTIGLARQFEELRGQITGVRTVKTNNNDTSTHNAPMMNISSLNRAIAVEEQERQGERIKGVERRLESELETIKKGMLRIEMQRGVQEAAERDIDDLKNDLDKLKHDFKARKNNDELWNASLKKNNGAEVGAIRDEISNLRIDLEMKLKQLEKGSLDYGKREFLRLELKEGEIENDLKILKEKMIVMDKKFEVQMEGKKKQSENYIKDQVLLESIQKEGKFVKEQQQVLTEIIERMSKDIVDYKLTQNFEGEEIKRRLRSIDDEQKLFQKRLQDFNENPVQVATKNLNHFLLTEDLQSPVHTSQQPKEGENFFDTRPSALGPQLSKLEENYRSQINRNVNNALSTLQRKLIEDIKNDFEAKMAIEKNANAFNKTVLDTEIESLKAKIMNIYERLDLSLSKDVQNIKTRVSFLEETDTYGPRIQNLSISLKALAKHLNIKINYEKGEIQLLRESGEHIYIPGPSSSPGKSIRKSYKELAPIDKDKEVELGLVDLVRGNLNRIADKLRVYHEIMNSLPDRTTTSSPLKDILQDASQSYIVLEKACDQVITLDELTLIVKTLAQKTNFEFTKLKEIIDDNVVAQNDYNISLADKVKDLEVAIESCQEDVNNTQEELTNLINDDSDIAMNKRDLRQNLESLNLRLEQISDHIKGMKDPISVRRLQTIISNPDSPTRVRQTSTMEQTISSTNEDLEERVGAMEFLMWRYARNFVEPEAQKKSMTIGRITVPVYEKLEHLMFLIKNCGFIQSKTIRSAIQAFKNALARLGRRCVQDKEEGFEELWRIIKSSPDLNTEQYYYLMEVLYALLSEERNNLQKAYEFKVFEFFLERLRKRDGSDPARACMLKILECLARTDVHMELITKTKIFPEIVVICKPMIDGWETNPGQHMKLQANEIKEQSDILELSEVDGLPSRTALLFYSLNLINEMIRNESLLEQADLTYLIRSLLNLLRKPKMIKHVQELALIILFRIISTTKRTYQEIFQSKENLEVIQNIFLSSSAPQEIKTLADDLLQVIRDTSKKHTEANQRVSSYVPFHRIRARFGGASQSPQPEAPSLTSYPRDAGSKTPPLERKRASFVVKSGNPRMPSLTRTNKISNSPLDTKATNSNKSTISEYPRQERKSDLSRRLGNSNRLNFQPFVTRTGLVSVFPNKDAQTNSKGQLNHRSSRSLLYGSRVGTEADSRQDDDDKNYLGPNRSFMIPGSHNDSSREEEFEETRKKGGLTGGVKVMGRTRGKLIEILNGKTTEETFQNNPTYTFRHGVPNPFGEEVIVPRLKIMDDPLSSLEIKSGIDPNSIEHTPYRY